MKDGLAGNGQMRSAPAELLLAALNHAQDGLIVVDHHGRVAFCNRSAIELLGLSPQQVLSRPLISELMARYRDVQAANAPNEAAQSIPPSASAEDGRYEYQRPDGIVLNIAAAPFNGGMLYTCKDVTELRQVQASLSECEREFGELAEKFRGVIGTVMRDVTERQNRAAELLSAKVAAEAATVAKSEFLASMSHEVRTPLNGILGYTDLLLCDESLESRHRQRVGKIRSAGNALLSVVNDILDFSEIESGGVVIDNGEFSVTSLIGSALEIVEPLILAKGLRLVTSIDPRIAPLVWGDEARLRQILLNLLNNAVKFTAAGSVGISVTLSAAGGGQLLRFDVSDTGIGIPEAQRGKLFQRFSQIDTSVRRKFGGAGLGLAISKQLVERMGGTISFESAEGKGSTFSIVLELPTAVRSSVQEVAEAEPVSKGKRVLLVEDIEMNGEIAQAMMAAAGYEVDMVADGVSAIASVQTSHYDVIFMDIQMPGLDGVTATLRIRELEHNGANTPIVAMTAHVIPSEVDRFLAAGMNDHIGKPFKRETLHAKLAKWCSPGLTTALAPPSSRSPLSSSAKIRNPTESELSG
ncbi:MAG: response regulator [Rhodopseudomonas sp.]|uniref:ATP-binding protein n=1 Tax=Rhodopseudomonas sp. TaxID=1078 RepID=UPI00179DCE04|nr:ATP-binding protein [Rhodopseudomonas sp.]NVN86939.1 response regulator [Rhodopseudomonas sp.]